MLTCLIDVRMHVCISLAAVQLDFSGAVSVDSLEPSACSGITIGTYNGAFDSAIPLLELFMLSLAHAAHSPSSGTPCVSGTLFLALSLC